MSLSDNVTVMWLTRTSTNVGNKKKQQKFKDDRLSKMNEYIYIFMKYLNAQYKKEKKINWVFMGLFISVSFCVFVCIVDYCISKSKNARRFSVFKNKNKRQFIVSPFRGRNNVLKLAYDIATPIDFIRHDILHELLRDFVHKREPPPSSVVLLSATLLWIKIYIWYER